MKIVVNGAYTYESDVAVRVGDRVRLPATDYSNEEREGRVTAVDSDNGYKGPCRRIVAVLPDGPQG